MIGALYKQRIQVADGLLPDWFDGVEMAVYNNKLHICNGWNNAYTPQLQYQHFRCDLDGTNREQLPDWAWNKHTFLLFVENGSLWNIGGNGKVDVQRYTEATPGDVGTKTTIQDDWNIDAYGREHFARTYDPDTGYAYIMGGHKYALPTEKMPYLYRAHKDDNFTVWEKIFDLPVEMQNADSGCLVKFRDALWFFAGGDVSAGTPYYVNTQIFKSIDGGFSWTMVVEDEPLFNSGVWGDAIATDHCILYLSGSDTNNSLTANNRLLVSYDGLSWYRLSLKITGRHATARCKDADDNIYFAMGFECNDLTQFKKIADINGGGY